MDPFLGQIVMFGGNFAPRGWAFCEGQLLAIAQNTSVVFDNWNNLWRRWPNNSCVARFTRSLTSPSRSRPRSEQHPVGFAEAETRRQR